MHNLYILQIFNLSIIHYHSQLSAYELWMDNELSRCWHVWLFVCGVLIDVMYANYWYDDSTNPPLLMYWFNVSFGNNTSYHTLHPQSVIFIKLMQCIYFYCSIWIYILYLYPMYCDLIQILWLNQRTVQLMEVEVED